MTEVRWPGQLTVSAQLSELGHVVILVLVHGHHCYFQMLLSCQSHECSYFTPVSCDDLVHMTRDRGDHCVHGTRIVSSYVTRRGLTLTCDQCTVYQ